MHPDDGPWKGVQPKCHAVVRIERDRYGIAAHLPDGSPVTIPLGAVPLPPPPPHIECRKPD
jgi:hypothetical protein